LLHELVPALVSKYASVIGFEFVSLVFANWHTSKCCALSQ